MPTCAISLSLSLLRGPLESGWVMVLKCPLGEAAEDAPRESEPRIAVSLC